MFRITNTSTKSAVISNDPEVAYNTVLKWTGNHEEAVEASSWVEIADIDSEYYGESFIITFENSDINA